MSHSADREVSSAQARITEELASLKSQRREVWILIAFAGTVLAFGGASFFFPQRFWQNGGLQISLSPQVLFVLLVGLVLVALFHVRREFDVRGLRLANIRHELRTQEAQTHSMIDGVTNVFSRAFLDGVVAREIASAESNDRPLVFMMCDLDNFKQVNDRYGHLIGDYVLAQVATIIKLCVRGSDFVVRYGGDEFLMLLPDTDSVGAEVVRYRIQRKIAEWERSNRLGELPISVSLGMHLHLKGNTADQDIAAADARMYADKDVNKRRLALRPAFQLH